MGFFLHSIPAVVSRHAAVWQIQRCAKSTGRRRAAGGLPGRRIRTRREQAGAASGVRSAEERHRHRQHHVRPPGISGQVDGRRSPSATESTRCRTISHAPISARSRCRGSCPPRKTAGLMAERAVFAENVATRAGGLRAYQRRVSNPSYLADCSSAPFLEATARSRSLHERLQRFAGTAARHATASSASTGPSLPAGNHAHTRSGVQGVGSARRRARPRHRPMSFHTIQCGRRSTAPQWR